MLVYFTRPTKRPGGHQSQLTIIGGQFNGGRYFWLISNKMEMR